MFSNALILGARKVVPTVVSTPTMRSSKFFNQPAVRVCQVMPRLQGSRALSCRVDGAQASTQPQGQGFLFGNKGGGVPMVPGVSAFLPLETR